MQTRFRIEDYAWAREIADALLDRFEDAQGGGFFFTSHDHERLIHRPKPGHDHATPSGNGVAASALISLGHLAAQPRYLEAAERAVRVFADQIHDAPRGFASLIGALDALRSPPSIVLITGAPATTAQWHARLAAPLRAAARIYDVGGIALPPELRKGEPGGSVEAWVCRGMSCLPPMTSIDEVERELSSAR
jgi:uncharacterized protein YyaL (SSP411 family)